MSTIDGRRVAFVLGTRPELIKLAPLIRLMGSSAVVVHTGQHFDANMSEQFLAELAIGAPSLHLGVGGRSRGAQIGDAISALDQAFADQRPDAVIVHGDTNATVAGALAANAREIPLVHLEAGLRSFDRAMPEEHNRVVVDHLSDLCLAPTETNRANLAAEGIGGNKVLMIGNTVVDAVLEHLPPPAQRADILGRHGLSPRRYVLSTLHRPENVDHPETLASILSELADLDVPVVMPTHPRTLAACRRNGLGPLLDRLEVRDPMGYGEFLALAAEAAVLISDSGGVQEESSVVKRPALVVRRSTERPEILGTFAHLVPAGPAIGRHARSLLASLDQTIERLSVLPSPYGDGSSANRAAAAIDVLLSRW